MSLPSLPNKNAELLDAAALFASGLVPLEEGAALAALTADEFAATLEDPETLAQLEPHLARMKSSGKLTEARALAMLDKLLTGIEAQLDDMSPTMATRVAEMLLRVSGIQERRAAEIKHAAPPEGSGFSINFIFPDKEAARLSGGVVLDGEAVEVCDV